MTEAAKAVKNAYQRKWRRDHQQQARKAREKYWEKLAKQLLDEHPEVQTKEMTMVERLRACFAAEAESPLDFEIDPDAFEVDFDPDAFEVDFDPE